MSNLKILVLYYSSTGTNYKMANWAAEAVRQRGALCRIAKAAELVPQEYIDENPAWRRNHENTTHIPVAKLDDLEWAHGLIISTPTRYGNVPAQLKQFLDSTGSLWREGKLKDKTVTAMSSAMNPHGGQEQTILSIYTTMFHWGAIVVSPGYTHPSFYEAGGNPYGTSVSVDENGHMNEDIKDAVLFQALRLVDITERIRHSREVVHS